jgi:hypothetical protein
LPQSPARSILYAPEPHSSYSRPVWIESALSNIPANHDQAIVHEAYDHGATSWFTGVEVELQYRFHAFSRTDFSEL